MGELNIAIICGTPYQLFNAINLIYSGEICGNIDIYIFDRFKLAHNVKDALVKLKDVRNVILLKDYKKDIVFNVKIKGLLKNIHSAYIYLTPKRSLKQYFSNEIEWKYTTKTCRYSRILAPTPSFFLQCLTKINEGAQLDYFEDGIGSYSGNFNSDSASWERKIFSKFFHVGYNVLPVTELYVYQPQMCVCTVSERIKKIPDITSAFLAFSESVFAPHGINKIENKSCIWFTQTTFTDIDKEIICSILEFNKALLVRMHPKDKNKNEYVKLEVEIDDEDVLWELLAGLSYLEDSVLISSYSTAMITPKLLYGSEPTLIFMYKLFNITDSVVLKKIEFFINQIKGIYMNKNKIVVPSDIQELKKCLLEL